MSPKLHSISEVLEIRDRCRNIKDKESPEKAREPLTR